MIYEYPVALMQWLSARKIKLADFEGKLSRFTEFGFLRSMNPDKVGRDFNRDFFTKYYHVDPLPECDDMFQVLMEARQSKAGTMPKFVMPSSMVTDIRMQKTADLMVGTPVEWKSVFAMPQMRKGQVELLKGLYASTARNKIMAAPTGIGKTLVMLAYASGKPTLIVEPDRGLQIQLRDKYQCTILMGRANYRCRDHHTTADVSPCRFLDPSESTCSKGCAWYDAHHKALDTLDNSGVVVTNSWNMWQFFQNVELVIFDEFHKILSELTVRYEIPYEVTDTTGLAYLQNRNVDLNSRKSVLWNQLKEHPDDADGAREYNAILNEIQSLMLFIENYEGSYIYEDDEHKYLKLDKIATMSHIARHYNVAKLFVSATPVHIPDVDLIVTTDTVSKLDNAPVVYYPIGKLTSFELGRHPDVLKHAASIINTIFEYFSEHGYTKKMIVHVGNTTTHMGIARYLHMKHLVHTKGELKEVYESFTHGDYDALLIASADAGYDFYGADFGLQFILKVPYPTRNSEWTSIGRKFGELYEQNLYSAETITQIVQAAGRICRGSDDVGMTVILDSKFADLFNNNREKFPEDFVDRLVDLSGDLKGVVSREKIDYYQQETVN